MIPGYTEGVVKSEQTDDSAPSCPISRCADVIGGKWTILVIRDLAEGPRYFSELETGLSGISPRTLVERLKCLVAEGLVTRTRIKALPPRTVYELTDKGAALVPLLGAMRDYASTYLVQTTTVTITTTTGNAPAEELNA